jgi:acetyl-CoA decarbonylase/synthase complex subunit gamma
MALTGLEIYKLLPKTNCKECGQPTCLAFAMQLAAGKASLEKCPYVSEEAKEALGAASAPPIALVKVGAGERVFTAGNETVLFRHDKRFEHPTGIAVTLADDLPPEEIAGRVEEINALCFDRVGQLHCVDLVAVKNVSGDPAVFAGVAKAVSGKTNLALILMSEDPGAMEAAIKETAAFKPLIYAATAENYEKMAALAKEHDTALAVKGENLATLADLVSKITAVGVKQLVLDTGAREVNQVLGDQTQLRRQALKRFRPFGYPSITFAAEQDPVARVIEAGVHIAKYAGIVVLDTADRAEILPLLTLRLNIYTDPQKPIAVEPKVYEIGAVNENSPLYVTTNFSLSYFCVAGDIEASRVPGYVLTVDTDGTSVFTAWAAGKFTPEKIAAALSESGAGDKVAHRKVIIPGGVAVLSGKLQELSGWEVLVGPRESAGIPAFLKQFWN